MSHETSSIRRLIIVLALLISTGENANADFTFGRPTNLGPTINTSSGDAFDCFSADGLEMYFDSGRPGGRGGFDLWVARRPTTDDDWGAPENLGSPVNTGDHDVYANISADGLELYFSRGERGDIWLTTRATTDDDWGNPVNLGPVVNTSGREHSPAISTDGLELYFTARNRAGGYGSDDIWVTRRATKNDPWESPVNLGAVVNTSASEAAPSLTADGLMLFFSEDKGQRLRPGGDGGLDMWLTRRASVSEPWETPVNLGPIVNTASLDAGPRISPDGFTLQFTSERPGGFGGVWGDIYQAPIIPVVDFTGDYKIDIEDLILLIEHWGQNERSVDMAPMPWGDGVVDAQDLEVLMRYWGKAVDDPRFLAHWKMDEIDGDVAYDSVGKSDAVVIGDAVWQPEGGQVGGALQLDGIDDYLNTLFVLNPADTVFSVFAWIKGGGPGQVILSQSGGANWLMLDAQGFLKTTLKGSRREKDLTSAAAIMGDSWHRVGFTWDGNDRVLYVDDNEVARDTQGGLQGSRGDLTIGAGNNLDLDPGAFWSGLIDDVRLYDRVVTP